MESGSVGENDGGGDEVMGVAPEDRQPEEPDHVHRRNKKDKGTVDGEATTDETMAEAQQGYDLDLEVEPKSPERRLVSYRDLVAGGSRESGVGNVNEDEADWEEDDLSDDDMEEGDLKKK